MLDLYDELIRDIKSLLNQESIKQFDPGATDIWPDAGNANMILRSDMAYELGGSTKPLAALGGTLFTESDSLIGDNSVFLIGPDLGEIKDETPYARISLVRVNAELFGSGDQLYDNIRKTENTRYRINPEGFMMRVSSIQNREAVRVSKEAISKGISFSHIGKAFSDAFMKLPYVEAVQTIFITDERFAFPDIEKKLSLSEGITKTIDHVFKNLSMDCKACNLKEICDEVEGLRELHFKNANN